MRRRRNGTALVLRGTVAALAAAALAIGYTATAGNTLPTSNATTQSFSISVADLAPPECTGLSLTSVVADSGSYNGNGNELVLGTSGADFFGTRNGDNCIVLGAGSDTMNLRGSPQVCIVNSSVNTRKCTTVVIRP